MYYFFKQNASNIFSCPSDHLLFRTAIEDEIFYVVFLLLNHLHFKQLIMDANDVIINFKYINFLWIISLPFKLWSLLCVSFRCGPRKGKNSTALHWNVLSYFFLGKVSFMMQRIAQMFAPFFLSLIFIVSLMCQPNISIPICPFFQSIELIP